MRTVEELIAFLSALGVKLWSEDGRLRFSAPQGVLTAALRTEMAERKAEILTLLEDAAQAAKMTSVPIPLVRRTADLPLSFAQQRLWYLHQLDPASPAYNVPIAVRLRGPLDRDALQTSIDRIVDRHEALRTVFPGLDGRPTQRILSAQPVKIDLVDLRSVPLAAREQQALALSNEAARAPFVLATGPLLRGTLVQLADEEHFLVLAIHHIISDGLSLGVLMQELASIYNAFRDGDLPSLPGLPIQYVDFTGWQRDRLRGPFLDEQISYWTRQLKDIPESLDLPADRPRPSDQTFRGAAEAFALRLELVESLRSLARQTNATIFMVLLSAFYILLSRYTGQDDIIVGTPIHGRTRPELRNLIGCFINTLALRGDLSEDPTFIDLVARVRTMTLMAFDHQELPFEKLVEVLHPTRDLGRSPLFQTMFVLQNLGLPVPDLRDLSVQPLEIETGSSAFDLTLTLQEMGDGLTGAVEYSSDLFDVSTIRRMIGHYETLLGNIVKNPQQRIAELPMLTPAEEKRLVEEWNRTTQIYPEGQCVHRLVEAQAARAPEAIAIRCGTLQLTYGELDRRANQLARHLDGMRIGPGQTVGIMLERSTELYLTVLGILKAGAAYVPIDPAFPRQRIAYIAQDAGLSALLTQASLVEALPEFSAPVLSLDAVWDAIAYQDDGPLAVDVTAEHWAYVIYTSGSTGKPKGVPVRHRSLANYMHAARDLFTLEPADRVLQFASLSFDTAAEEIFPAWACGATVVARSDLMLASVSTFLQTCADLAISVLDLPTSYWHQIVFEMDAGRLELPDALRLVIIGGERALPRHLVTWQRLVGNRVRLLNTYGPTEATIVATCWELPGHWAPDHANRQVPIGRPIANVRAYVLDGAMQVAPIGVPGELYLGGAGLAVGYLNQPELTRERFVPDPFSTPDKSGTPGQRLYRTGDRVRYLLDGNLEYLGRSDDQVKLRGFRIELGEIEANLTEHPGVREVVVVLREETSGGTEEQRSGGERLVAYIVPRECSASALTAEQLRPFVAQRLPAYMVPSSFEILEDFPRTASGKIDRNRLPAPQRPDHIRSDDELLPRNEVEQTLTAIWSSVLGIERIGRDDNFFELGGDSILSIQVVARAHQSGLRLTPKQFLQAPTIAEQAAFVRHSDQGRAEQGTITGAAPLTPIQRWFFAQAFPEPDHWSQALLLQVPHEIDHRFLPGAVAAVMAHHDLLRARFERRSDGVHQVIGSIPDEIPYLQVDLSTVSEPDQAGAISFHAAQIQGSLRLEAGPLLRVACFLIGPNRPYRLLLVVHHLVIDTVSWRILLEDLASAYHQLKHTESQRDAERGAQSGGATRASGVRLPAKTTAYTEWARRLVAYAASESLAAELPFWLEQLADTPAAIPVDCSDGENREALAQDISLVLDADRTRLLLQHVPQAYHTRTNEVLLTALAQTLIGWCGFQAIVIELEGHGREDIFEDVDLSRSVGWFTALYPFRLDLRGVNPQGSVGPDLGKALKQIKEQLRRVPNGGIGYGLLRYLSPDELTRASLLAHATPQVLFNYLGQMDRTEGPAAQFQPAKESVGPSRGVNNIRGNLLEITGLVVDGKLHVEWRYSEAIHRRSTIMSLANTYLTHLNALIDHCLSPAAGGYTPSDFPEAKISQRDLDKLMTRIKRQDGS